MKKILAENETPERLDAWLTRHVKEKSRSAWQKQIEAGNVRVNRRKVSSSHSIKNGDTVEIVEPVVSELAPSEYVSTLPDILFEDKNYLILDKPAGLVVHPSAGHHENTLTHRLRAHYGDQLSETGGTDRPGIVHRLDKDTSGLLVIAKNDATHQNLAEQFKQRTVKKTYQALVHGHMEHQQGSIEAPLSRSESHRKKIAVTARTSGRYALTHYKVTKTFALPFPCSLLEVTIETGRTHQIRVHLDAIGHPVVGDEVYGKKSLNDTAREMGLGHQFLHAMTLEFTSPTTHKTVTYHSEIPKNLRAILSELQ